MWIPSIPNANSQRQGHPLPPAEHFISHYCSDLPSIYFLFILHLLGQAPTLQQNFWEVLLRLYLGHPRQSGFFGKLHPSFGSAALKIPFWDGGFAKLGPEGSSSFSGINTSPEGPRFPHQGGNEADVLQGRGDFKEHIFRLRPLPENLSRFFL